MLYTRGPVLFLFSKFSSDFFPIYFAFYTFSCLYPKPFISVVINEYILKIIVPNILCELTLPYI